VTRSVKRPDRAVPSAGRTGESAAPTSGSAIRTDRRCWSSSATPVIGPRSIEDVPDEEDRPRQQGEGVPADDPALEPAHPVARGANEVGGPVDDPSMKRASNICHSPVDAFTIRRITAHS